MKATRTEGTPDLAVVLLHVEHALEVVYRLERKVREKNKLIGIRHAKRGIDKKQRPVPMISRVCEKCEKGRTFV